MVEIVCNICGGCPLRNLEEQDYQAQKTKEFHRIINKIKNLKDVKFDMPIFIKDGNRRRADMEFKCEKKDLKLGFNESKTHNIVDVTNCFMLNKELDDVLPALKNFLLEFCQIPITIRKKKKIEIIRILSGSVKLLSADNGVDVLLQLSQEPVLEHRLLCADFLNSTQNLVRISWQINSSQPETIAQSTSPLLNIADYHIDIPQNVFLQASKIAETKMIEKVMEYMQNTQGRIADLFCGLGTFTYPLAKNKLNNIISVDSSEVSLIGLKKALNCNLISNVQVINRNLFKYPLDEKELKGVKAIVMDPPRAGAHAQCREIAMMKEKVEKIVFISCNPETFVADADILIDAGYNLTNITLIDQFVYSKHMELIALFSQNP